eukprot:gene22122-26660_t
MEAPLTIDEARLAQLRRKLESLNYGDTFDLSSVPLIQKLDVLYQDNARLLKENNALHLQLIKDAEGGDSKERRSSLTVKKLEDEIAELKYLSLETSHDDLKKRLEELVEEGRGRHPSGFQPPDIRLVDAHVAPGFNSKARVDLSAGLCRGGGGFVSIVAAGADPGQWDRAVLDGGRDVERMTLEYRNEANEKTIISLNQQVEFLTLQLSRVESEAAQGRELQTTMAKMCSQSGESDVSNDSEGDAPSAIDDVGGGAFDVSTEKERLTANLQETLRENSE